MSEAAQNIVPIGFLVFCCLAGLGLIYWVKRKR